MTPAVTMLLLGEHARSPTPRRAWEAFSFLCLYYVFDLLLVMLLLFVLAQSKNPSGTVRRPLSSYQQKQMCPYT